jgi:hypothetical protein
VAFRLGTQKIQSTQKGFLLQDKESIQPDYPSNQGKRWTDEESARLSTRYLQLLPQFKTKRKTIERLQQEFNRGYFSILNRLEQIQKE